MTNSITDHSNNETVSDSQPDDPARSPRVGVSPLITLIAGLTIGLLAGYFGRPWLAPLPNGPTAVTRASTGEPATPTPTNIDSVIVQTRHFKGDANAAVTLIEFGDFQ
jgi:hypothetical protein